jgi:hypothetical protein
MPVSKKAEATLSGFTDVDSALSVFVGTTADTAAREERLQVKIDRQSTENACRRDGEY